MECKTTVFFKFYDLVWMQPGMQIHYIILQVMFQLTFLALFCTTIMKTSTAIIYISYVTEMVGG